MLPNDNILMSVGHLDCLQLDDALNSQQDVIMMSVIR